MYVCMYVCVYVCVCVCVCMYPSLFSNLPVFSDANRIQIGQHFRTSFLDVCDMVSLATYYFEQPCVLGRDKMAAKTKWRHINCEKTLLTYFLLESKCL